MARVIRHLFGDYGNTTNQFVLPFVPRASTTWRSVTASWWMCSNDTFTPQLSNGGNLIWRLRAAYENFAEWRMFEFYGETWALTIPFGDGVTFDGNTRVDALMTGGPSSGAHGIALTWIGFE